MEEKKTRRNICVRRCEHGSYSGCTGRKNFRGRFRLALPEFRLDGTRIVFIAMRKLSLRSFKKNNAACKVSLLEFNKVRARAVSFNYSPIARESTDQIYIYIYIHRGKYEFRQLMIGGRKYRWLFRSIFERNLNISTWFDAQTLCTVIKIQGTTRNVNRTSETIGKLVESGRIRALDRFYSIGIREKRRNIESLHVSRGK